MRKREFNNLIIHVDVYEGHMPNLSPTVGPEGAECTSCIHCSIFNQSCGLAQG